MRERHSPLENREPLKTGFDQLLVHFEAVKWSNCSKNKITSGTRARTEIKFALDGQGPHNFTQPISTGSKRLFDILVFRLKYHSLLWGLESNFRGSTQFFCRHQAAISRPPLQTRWAAYVSLFGTARLLTLALAGLMRFHCGCPSWQYLSGSYCGIRALRLQLCCQKRATQRERDKETARVMRGDFHVLFLIVFLF